MGVHCDYTDEWYDGRLSLAGCLGKRSGNMLPRKPQLGISLDLLRLRVVGAGFDLALDECTYICVCVCVYIYAQV